MQPVLQPGPWDGGANNSVGMTRQHRTLSSQHVASAAHGWHNVLYLIADDMRPLQPGIQTPNLNKLAASGLTFANAYAQWTCCGPSRASFMTGRRPHHTRFSLKVSRGPKTFRETGVDAGGLPAAKWTTLPGSFKKRGYLTLGGGKTFHPTGGRTKKGYMDGADSWDLDKFTYFPHYYFISDGKLDDNNGNPCESSHAGAWTFCALDAPDDYFYDHHLTNATIERLDYANSNLRSTGQPFFIAAGFARPHTPFQVPTRFHSLYENGKGPPLLPKHNTAPNNMPAFAYPDSSEKRTYTFYTPEDGVEYDHRVDAPLPDHVAKRARRAYFAAVSFVDYEVGRLLDELERHKLEDKTIVCFHSDHGYHLGESNIWLKYNNFELSTRVPLIVRAPSFATSVGRTSTLLAELIDVYPTLLDLASPHSLGELLSSSDDTLDGVSLVPAFDDPSLTWISVQGMTENKTRAFSQYPRPKNLISSNGDACPWSVGGICSDTRQNVTAVDPNSCSLCGSKAEPRLGFSMRTRERRLTAWVRDEEETEIFVSPQQWTSDYMELYDVSDDFDEMDRNNVAYHSNRSTEAKDLYDRLKMALALPIPSDWTSDTL